MSDRPDPLTPPDCDLRGFEWMPLDVANIVDSDLFLEATGDEFKAAFALWCRSWRQVPAASLPNKETVLAGLSGAKNWKKVRAVAMRNWVLCSDDRWYHPVVAAKALEAWPSRQEFEHKKTAEAERKQRERADRKALFELLRANGVVPSWDTKTAELRKMAQPFQPPPVVGYDPVDVPPAVTGDVTDIVTSGVTGAVTGGVTGHGHVTAKRGTGQEQDRDHDGSVPDGTGGRPPSADKPRTPAEEEKSQLWRKLKTALVDQKTCKDFKTAGVLLGRAAKQYGEAVFIEAARATVAAHPGNTHTYLIELCERAAGKRQTLNRQVQLEDTNFAAAAAFAGD